MLILSFLTKLTARSTCHLPHLKRHRWRWWRKNRTINKGTDEYRQTGKSNENQSHMKLFFKAAGWINEIKACDIMRNHDKHLSYKGIPPPHPPPIWTSVHTWRAQQCLPSAACAECEHQCEYTKQHVCKKPCVDIRSSIVFSLCCLRVICIHPELIIHRRLKTDLLVWKHVVCEGCE